MARALLRFGADSSIRLTLPIFRCFAISARDRGGEVLKFMGDGLLAIFPVTKSRTDAEKVCNDALAAALDARTNIAKLGGSTGIEGVDDVRFGLALHLGDVLYGNIGGGNRLDFTCVGPAVNLAARLEKLAGRLGRTVLASDVFARHCGARLTPIGEFPLSGFHVAQRVYGIGEVTHGNP